MSEKNDYWKSDKGLDTRIADIAHDYVWGLYNNIIALTLLQSPLADFIEWKTMNDDRVCPLCEDNEGTYELGEDILPELPQHVGCRCAWDVPD